MFLTWFWLVFGAIPGSVSSETDPDPQHWIKRYKKHHNKCISTGMKHTVENKFLLNTHENNNLSPLVIPFVVCSVILNKKK